MQQSHHYIIRHTLPGRLRVVFPILISDKTALQAHKQSIKEISGVRKIITNKNNGGVTVHYDSEMVKESRILSRMDGLAGRSSAAVIEVKGEPVKKQALQVKPYKKPRKNRFIQALWNLAGSFFVGVGILGIFLPILPTVPLILLAAFCYFRGSSRFYNWLTRFGALGRVIKSYRSGQGLTLRTKLRVILLMWVSVGISIIFLVSGLTFRLILLTVGFGVTVHILMLKTAEPTKSLPVKAQAVLPKPV
jgi:uncharacterized membrane protein YbaN (DUF454 family)